MVLSATAIVLLDRPRVIRLASLVYLIVMNRPVSPFYRVHMNFRDVFLSPSRCGLSVVL